MAEGTSPLVETTLMITVKGKHLTISQAQALLSLIKTNIHYFGFTGLSQIAGEHSPVWVQILVHGIVIEQHEGHEIMTQLEKFFRELAANFNQDAHILSQYKIHQ